MKVLFVSSGNSDYGVVPFIKSQGESLKEIGIELDYFLIKGKGISGYLKNIAPLKKQIKREKYDIIHSHYGLIGLTSLLTFTKVPKILSIMGSDAYGSYDSNGKRKISSFFEMFLTQVAMLFSNQLIVKSENLLNIVPYKYKVTIVPNGVNFSVFKPYSNLIEKNKVLWLANPKDPRKNFKLISDAMEYLPKEVELVNPFPIKHNQFPKYLNNSSVFVLTSYNEGSPNVIKEAMACNIPVVTTNVGDVKKVIGKTKGCFITDFDEKMLADRINLVLKIGKRTCGRKDIEHLDSIKVAKKIEQIYLTSIKK